MGRQWTQQPSTNSLYSIVFLSSGFDYKAFKRMGVGVSTRVPAVGAADDADERRF